MDANDIFFKLSAGAKFTPGKFKIKPKNFQHNIKKEKINVNKNSTNKLLNIKDETDSSNDDEVSNSNIIKPVSTPKNLPTVKSENSKPLVVKESSICHTKALFDNLTVEKDKKIRIKDKTKKKKKKKKKITAKALERREREEIAALRKKFRITTVGEEIPAPFEDFEELKEKYNVSSLIIKNLAQCGFQKPTGIQMQAIPVLLEKKQIVACAPTGSGKTAAYLVPLINDLKCPQKSGFRAVIVCPTRELKDQVYRECLRISEGTGLRINIIRKNPSPEDISTNFQKYDILIGTPKRLVYMLRTDPPMLNLQKVEWLIVDECDKLFEIGKSGFRDQLAVIYNACSSPTIKRAMFSATYDVNLANWCKENLENLILITVGVRNSVVDTVKQELLFVGNEDGKLVAFRDLIRKGLTPPVLVFVESKERAQELFNELIYDGINVDVIHADRTQKQRDNVIQSFREGKIWILICTELMGRGIDFRGVNLVVNYDFPRSAVSYIHRIGRTGRAGRQGHAITYFTLNDTLLVSDIAQLMKNAGCDVPDYLLHCKKANKKLKKKMARTIPERESISTNPRYRTTEERKRKRQEIEENKEESESKRKKVDLKRRRPKLPPRKLILENKGKKQKNGKSRSKGKILQKGKTPNKGKITNKGKMQKKSKN